MNYTIKHRLATTLFLFTCLNLHSPTGSNRPLGVPKTGSGSIPFWQQSWPIPGINWGLGLSWRFLLRPGRWGGSWSSLGSLGFVASNGWIVSTTSMFLASNPYQILLTYLFPATGSDSELGRHVVSHGRLQGIISWKFWFGFADSARVKTGSGIFRNTHFSWHGKRSGLRWMHELGCTGFGLFDKSMIVYEYI